MFNYFEPEMKIDSHPACAFEASLLRVAAPEKSLNAVEINVRIHSYFNVLSLMSIKKSSPTTKPVAQRNCQTWIVESADQLVLDSLLNHGVAEYLHTIRQ